MIVREFYPLSMAALVVGCSEDDLIYLGRVGKLNFYIDPGNWARRKLGSLTALMINDPILIDDPVHLSKLARDLECTLFFTEQYPDYALEDKDAIKSDSMENSHEEFSDPEFGVIVTRDRLVIMAADLMQLRQQITNRSESNYLPIHPHQSQRLKLLFNASEHFWKNADPKDRDTHPTNEAVSKWLVGQGLSKRLADAGTSIIRPEWAATGRKPD